VKTEERHRTVRPNVLWQEAAEMIMIPQDNNEIYLTFATYPPEYLEYFKRGSALRRKKLLLTVE
ncbi:uncharacterized protein N7487_008774, partial [Penicillium crustosum]|uniref:uncharacterized protein n=1 Tax=Penicillium crustosum TaxID=36656 RepID=UPI002394DDC8